MPKRAHLIREGPSSGFPSIPTMSSFDRAFTQSRFFPFASSVSIEADAWLMAQPFPVNLISLIVLPSPTLICISTSSPQSGLVSRAEMSNSSSFPKLRGFL